ncbi:hypothetical protein [Arthrobacter sp. 2MCAF14]|uniref:hypothetical protein n=1 Tax=Arthrobacter sp. 2MCAF14 TaxID=3232982 RepID=UPI003F930B4D
MKGLIHMPGNNGQRRVCLVAEPHDSVVVHACGTHERTGGLRHVDGLVGSNAYDGSVGLMR